MTDFRFQESCAFKVLAAAVGSNQISAICPRCLDAAVLVPGPTETEDLDLTPIGSSTAGPPKLGKD